MLAVDKDSSSRRSIIFMIAIVIIIKRMNKDVQSISIQIYLLVILVVVTTTQQNT